VGASIMIVILFSALLGVVSAGRPGEVHTGKHQHEHDRREDVHPPRRLNRESA
jgi:hypothetical protein